MPSKNDSRARSNANLIPFKPGQSGNPNGRGHFHAQALRMARDMTPAAIRRLGELGGLLPGPDGEWIPLEKLGIDARVVEIACMTLVERTMGKPREYDPAAEREPSRLDLSKLTVDQRQQLRELLMAATSTVAAEISASGETTVE